MENKSPLALLAASFIYEQIGLGQFSIMSHIFS